MKRLTIRNTDLSVSPLALGTTGFGTKLNQADAFRQMDAFMDAGGNLIDTAYVYGCSPDASEPHASENIVGRWLKEKGAREKMVIATKGAHPLLDDPAFRPRLGEAEILSDLHESLARLQTDAVDLYFLHRDDESIPVGEILETMEKIRKSGKIRHYGFSNWKAHRAREAHEYSVAHGLEGFCVDQLMWSLAHVTHAEITDKTLVAMDKHLYSWHKETGVAAMAYRSLAKGYFTKRFRNASVRSDLRPVFETNMNDRIFNALIALHAETGLSVTLLSLMFFEFQPFPSVAIASYSTFAQLEEGLSYLKSPPSKEISEHLLSLRHDLFDKEFGGT